MTIQDAIKACLSKKDCFARPVSWKGTGEAIDLARRLDKSRARRIQSMQSPNNLIGCEWNVDPKDFLDDWEVLGADDLAQEVCQKGE